jgi:hypothetical protein
MFGLVVDFLGYVRTKGCVECLRFHEVLWNYDQKMWWIFEKCWKIWSIVYDNNVCKFVVQSVIDVYVRVISLTISLEGKKKNHI